MTHVTAVLVSHDGGRWLTPVLDGIEHQSRPADRVVAIESGMGGESLALLRRRLPDQTVVTVAPSTPFAGSVRAALEEAGPPPGVAAEDAWIWLIHDDSRPDEGCLEQLLAAHAQHPSATVIGPKLREWPSLRRLLELGVSLSHTGRRETGLERGEYDQGQHDQIRQVLAVNTAGMLVRRDVLERLGFDANLPVVGTDIDFGWRAARAGYTTIVAPEAVVFHAEATHRGLRTSALSRHVRRRERSAALYTLATNVSAWRLPLLLLRMLLRGLLRPIGLLLIRAPGEAWDELLAVVGTVGRPWRILAGRIRRRRTNVLKGRQIAHLLPPWWLPLRAGLDHGLEASRGVLSILMETSGPIDMWQEEEESDAVVDGTFATVRAVVTGRPFLVGTTLTVAALFAGRGLFTGILGGGALPPALSTAGQLWSTYVESWHDIGTGTAAPAAPYLLPLAGASALLGGHTEWVVRILLLLAVPIAALGALRFVRRFVPSRVTGLWAAVTYGLLPVATGAVEQGRLGTVVFLLLLPHLAIVLIDLVAHPDPDRRRRGIWRAALLLFLSAAFAPVVLVLAAAGFAVSFLAAMLAGGRAGARTVLPVAAPIAVAFLLLTPWSLTVWFLGDPLTWLTGAGWQASGLLRGLGPWDLLLGRAGGTGAVGAAPGWFSIGIIAAALGSLLRVSGRGPAVLGWAAALGGVAAAAALSYVHVVPPGGSVALPIWVGVPASLALAALVFTGGLAGAGARTAVSGRSFGWRQPVTAVLVVAALITPVVTLGWWLDRGSGDPVTLQVRHPVPDFMLQAGATRPADGTLWIEGGSNSFTYTVLRGHPIGLGDESVLPSGSQQHTLSAAVTALLTQPNGTTAAEVAGFGVRFVYLPPPADPELSAAFDAATGAFSPASSLRAGSRAWEMVPPATGTSLDVAPDHTRAWLVAGQLGALALVVVLAAPSRRRSR